MVGAVVPKIGEVVLILAGVARWVDGVFRILDEVLPKLERVLRKCLFDLPMCPVEYLDSLCELWGDAYATGLYD